MIYTFPLLLLAIGIVFHLVHSRRRHGKVEYLDLGQSFLLVVMVYGVIPGIGFLLAHLGIGQISDARLANGFDLELVESVQWMYLCFTASFTVIYLWVRRSAPITYQHQQAARAPARWLIPLAIALIAGLPLFLQLLGGNTGDDYISSYTALRSAPIVIQQLFGVATQLTFSVTVAAVVFAVAAQPRRHLFVAFVLALNLVYATLAGGSRSFAFLCFFAYLVAASVYVRKFTIGWIVAAGVPALLLFMLAGLLRDNNPDATYLGLFQAGEFTTLFINAIDLKDRFDNGFAAEIRFAFYFVDLIRIIPSQLIGGVKIDPAQWYVETFYEDYYDAGGGFAFGVLAESVAGWGAADAALRGALLGLIFSWTANQLMGGRTSVTRVFVYTWLVVLSYQSFRDTTFSLGVRGIYQLLPVLLMLAICKRLSRKVHTTAVLRTA